MINYNRLGYEIKRDLTIFLETTIAKRKAYKKQLTYYCCQTQPTPYKMPISRLFNRKIGI